MIYQTQYLVGYDVDGDDDAHDSQLFDTRAEAIACAKSPPPDTDVVAVWVESCRTRYVDTDVLHVMPCASVTKVIYRHDYQPQTRAGGATADDAAASARARMASDLAASAARRGCDFER